MHRAAGVFATLSHHDKAVGPAPKPSVSMVLGYIVVYWSKCLMVNNRCLFVYPPSVLWTILILLLTCLLRILGRMIHTKPPFYFVIEDRGVDRIY